MGLYYNSTRYVVVTKRTLRSSNIVAPIQIAMYRFSTTHRLLQFSADSPFIFMHVLTGAMSYIRGPRPRGQACIDHGFSSEILHRRVLSPEGGNLNARRTSSLCPPAEEDNIGLCTLSSANLRAQINFKPQPTSILDAQASRRRGWKVQGQIAGEWRDRLGRRRRACPTENPSTTVNAPAASEYATSVAAADMSIVSSIPEPSCAGTVISFEGLVDELRERLPHASPLGGLVATQQRSIAQHTCSGEEATISRMIATIDQLQEETTRARRIDGGGGDKNNNTVSQGTPPLMSGGAATGICTSGSTEPQGAGAAAGAMPGCLRLRYPMIGAMRVPANPQPLMRSVPAGGNTGNLRLNWAAAARAQPSLLLTPGATFLTDGNTHKLVGTDAVDTSDASPSAAMVAAAKAHERALPLLQVCAIKVVEPTGV